MKRFKTLFIHISIISTLAVSCSTSKKIVDTTPDFKKIKTEGRVSLEKNNIVEIYWPGSGFTVKFRGSEIKAILKDERGYNYFNVIIDDSLTRFIRIDTTKSTYTLASALSDTVHTIKLLKRADWFRGKTWLYGFEFPQEAKIYKADLKKRMIEFYGNSITVGAAVEDSVADRGDGIFTNNYYSYASLTARHFDADYSCIASSGIGVMASSGNLIMPEIYDRLNPDDSTSKWNFPKRQPGIVVINLFQNDSWIVHSPDFIQFKRRFGTIPPSEDFIINSYKYFVLSIRAHYPDANIICTLGSMDAVKPGSPWPAYIEKAVAKLDDKKIFTHFFTYLNKQTHPKIGDQKKMADELIKFIDQNIKW